MVVVFIGGVSSSGFTCFGSFCDVGVVARIVSFFVGCVRVVSHGILRYMQISARADIYVYF